MYRLRRYGRRLLDDVGNSSEPPILTSSPRHDDFAERAAPDRVKRRHGIVIDDDGIWHRSPGQRFFNTVTAIPACREARSYSQIAAMADQIGNVMGQAPTGNSPAQIQRR